MFEQLRLNEADGAMTIALIQNQTCTLQACHPKRRPVLGEASAVKVETQGKGAFNLDGASEP